MERPPVELPAEDKDGLAEVHPLRLPAEDKDALAEDHPLRWLAPTPPQSPRGIIEAQHLLLDTPAIVGQAVGSRLRAEKFGSTGSVEGRLSSVGFGSTGSVEGRLNSVAFGSTGSVESQSITPLRHSGARNAWMENLSLELKKRMGSDSGSGSTVASEDDDARGGYLAKTPTGVAVPFNMISSLVALDGRGDKYPIAFSQQAVVNIGVPVVVPTPVMMPITPVASQALSPMASPPVRRQDGPRFGQLHTFHQETRLFGTLSYDSRAFTKERFDGRLSIVTESEVRSKGVHHYAVQFTGSELSSADGVGFVFCRDLPCPKNIQRIISIFANRSGRICVRAQSEVVRSAITVKPLELGDWVGVKMDLDQQNVEFSVWPIDGRQPSFASVAYGEIMDSMRNQLSARVPHCGYLACVVKHHSVTVKLGS